MARALLEISKKALLHNLKAVTDFSKKKVIAVIKANAYGVGAKEVASLLEGRPQVEAYAVACAEEGVSLREAGFKKKILVLGGLLEEELPLFETYRLTPVVSDPEHLKLLKGKDLPFHVKYDTGMGRLGFLEGLVEDPRVEGVMTHLSTPADREFSLKQIEEFKKVAEAFKGKMVHLESSAGLVYRVPYATHVRVGLVLYGEKPLKDYPLPLRPALRLKARLISVKEVPAGFPISYGRTYRTPKRTKIGVVAFGYADGLMKSLSNKGYLLYRGKKLPILGNVTMDMTVVSLEGTEAKVGDWVEVVNEERPFTPLAKDAGTIPYELMCNLSERVKRKVVD